MFDDTALIRMVIEDLAEKEDWIFAPREIIELFEEEVSAR